jgi:hypothetical protein
MEISSLKMKSQVWWLMPIIPALRRLRQEDCKFKASLGHNKKRKKNRKD